MEHSLITQATRIGFLYSHIIGLRNDGVAQLSYTIDVGLGLGASTTIIRPIMVFSGSHLWIKPRNIIIVEIRTVGLYATQACADDIHKQRSTVGNCL